MLDVLLAQEHREDLAAGLPRAPASPTRAVGTRVRHGAGVVLPDDAPPYLIAVCTTTDLAGGDDQVENDACLLVAHISAQVWAARHQL
ncbi:hypothetical protein NKG94_48400 [Micromonospora sp. M12]